MHKVYFTRHGETVWNVENKICGTTDIALTDRGHQQAIQLGQQLARSGLAVDEILYSPLVRAADTARHIAQITGWPLREEPRLREQCFGRYEATARDGAEFRAAKACFAQRYDGGESMLRLAQRIYDLLDELRGQDKTCLLVAHNGISRVVESYFREMTNEEFAAFGIRNCEFREYVFPE
ncbi:MAG: histidine phosphatase family protein [Faecalibacterium sp.]